MAVGSSRSDGRIVYKQDFKTLEAMKPSSESERQKKTYRNLSLQCKLAVQTKEGNVHLLAQRAGIFYGCRATERLVPLKKSEAGAGINIKTKMRMIL